MNAAAKTGRAISGQTAMCVANLLPDLLTDLLTTHFSLIANPLPVKCLGHEHP